jgi:hypothetical protein
MRVAGIARPSLSRLRAGPSLRRALSAASPRKPATPRMSAEAPPAADGAPAHSVTEGRATIYFDRANEVFYNKVQCLNRDLSVLMLRLFVAKRKEEHAARAAKKGRQPGPLRGIRIAEPLAASGLRSIRYAKEVPDAPDDVDSVIVNDIDAAAVEAIRRNVRLNGLEAGGKMQPSQSDASALLVRACVCARVRARLRVLTRCARSTSGATSTWWISTPTARPRPSSTPPCRASPTAGCSP